VMLPVAGSAAIMSSSSSPQLGLYSWWEAVMASAGASSDSLPTGYFAWSRMSCWYRASSSWFTVLNSLQNTVVLHESRRGNDRFLPAGWLSERLHEHLQTCRGRGAGAERSGVQPAPARR